MACLIEINQKLNVKCVLKHDWLSQNYEANPNNSFMILIFLSS